MEPGETRQFTITYPNDYANPELAGGTVDYTVTLNEVKKRVVPDLDDELARDLGEFDSLDALRARVREDLEAEARQGAAFDVRKFHSAVLDRGSLPLAVLDDVVRARLG